MTEVAAAVLSVASGCWSESRDAWDAANNAGAIQFRRFRFCFDQQYLATAREKSAK